MSSFKCGVHLDENGKEYSTPDFEQWKLHVANLDHEHVGYNKCTDCGEQNIPVKITTKLKDKASPNAYCDVCIIKLKEHIAKLEVSKNV